MNVTPDLARQVVEGLKGSPFVLALLAVNVLSLIGFAYTLHEVSAAQERREGLLKACIERRP